MTTNFTTDSTPPKRRILVDTREKDGWFFLPNEWCLGYDRLKLSTGDYTIQGLESLVTIERKASVSEIATNVVEKRFWAEMERLKSYEYAYLLCEFTEKDILGYPHNTKMPAYAKRKVKLTPQFIISRIQQFADFGVKVIFCGNKFRAFKEASRLLQEIGINIWQTKQI